MKKKTSLKDIAERVGVSVALVSYVLNNRLQDKINKDTAARIRKVAQEMNYYSNQIAKSLQQKKSQTLGLIISDITNPFSSTIARIVQEEAEKKDYTVIFGSVYERVDRAKKLTEVFLSRQVDGIIMAPPPGFESYLNVLKKQEIPLVLIDRYFPNLKLNSIRTNDYSISFKAIDHLIQNGFQNIGIINYDSDLFHLKERTSGYKEALKKANLPLKKYHMKEIEEEKLEETLPRAMDTFLYSKDPIDAIFFTSSNIAIAGLAYLSQHQIQVPNDLGVICFDQIKYYQVFPVSLTHIKQPLKRIGQAALQLLEKAIEDPKTSEIITLGSELIIGKSSLRTKDLVS